MVDLPSPFPAGDIPVVVWPGPQRRAWRAAEVAAAEAMGTVNPAVARLVAALAPALLIAQLDRVLRSLPEQAGGSPERPEPERVLRLRDSRDGGRGASSASPPTKAHSSGWG